MSCALPEFALTIPSAVSPFSETQSSAVGGERLRVVSICGAFCPLAIALCKCLHMICSSGTHNLQSRLQVWISQDIERHTLSARCWGVTLGTKTDRINQFALAELPGTAFSPSLKLGIPHSSLHRPQSYQHFGCIYVDFIYLFLFELTLLPSCCPNTPNSRGG